MTPGGFKLIYARPLQRPFALGDRYRIRHPKAGVADELQVVAVRPLSRPSGRCVVIDLEPVA